MYMNMHNVHERVENQLQMSACRPVARGNQGGRRGGSIDAYPPLPTPPALIAIFNY